MQRKQEARMGEATTEEITKVPMPEKGMGKEKRRRISESRNRANEKLGTCRE